jgi:hypothetical protein
MNQVVVGERSMLSFRTSFKSIDLSPCSTAESLEGENNKPMAIFRDIGCGGTSNNAVVDDQEDISLSAPALIVRRANPILERRMDDDDDDDDVSEANIQYRELSTGVISPYPFPQPSQEDMDEKEQLWKLQPTATIGGYPLGGGDNEPIDYAPYFAFAAASGSGEMECDDFSVSSCEANSLSDEDLEDISGDPASFWEGSIEDAGFSVDRSLSPELQSIESNLSGIPLIMPSPTSVTAVSISLPSDLQQPFK